MLFCYGSGVEVYAFVFYSSGDHRDIHSFPARRSSDLGGFDGGVRLVEACELFSHLANVGDTRSLILHPASTTHRQLTDEQREASGATPEVVRLSIGIETVADIIADLDQALDKV